MLVGWQSASRKDERTSRWVVARNGTLHRQRDELAECVSDDGVRWGLRLLKVILDCNEVLQLKGGPFADQQGHPTLSNPNNDATC